MLHFVSLSLFYFEMRLNNGITIAQNIIKKELDDELTLFKFKVHIKNTIDE